MDNSPLEKNPMAGPGIELWISILIDNDVTIESMYQIYYSSSVSFTFNPFGSATIENQVCEPAAEQISTCPQTKGNDRVVSMKSSLTVVGHTERITVTT